MSNQLVKVTVTRGAVVKVVIAGNIGARGPAGGHVAYVFTQDVPSALWTIAHGLNTYPGVTVVDTLGRVVEADVAYLDLNTITVAFANAATGQAFLN